MKPFFVLSLCKQYQVSLCKQYQVLRQITGLFLVAEFVCYLQEKSQYIPSIEAVWLQTNCLKAITLYFVVKVTWLLADQ